MSRVLLIFSATASAILSAVVKLSRVCFVSTMNGSTTTLRQVSSASSRQLCRSTASSRSSLRLSSANSRGRFRGRVRNEIDGERGQGRGGDRERVVGRCARREDG